MHAVNGIPVLLRRPSRNCEYLDRSVMQSPHGIGQNSPGQMIIMAAVFLVLLSLAHDERCKCPSYLVPKPYESSMTIANADIGTNNTAPT